MPKDVELYGAVATFLFQDKFYEKSDDRINRIRTLASELCAKNDEEFVGQLAVYSREQMHLRSVSVALAIELAKLHSGDNLVQKVLNRVVARPDEIMEALAYYEMINGKIKPLSKQVQKGLASAFNKFDEYGFAKYNRDGNITLRDALFLVHPKPEDEKNQLLFDKIANDSLETPQTWETQISKSGQDAKTPEEKEAAKLKAWGDMIDSGKMGYMAILRNLRNFLEAGVSHDHMAKVCARLADEKSVLKSKQFPFRFLSAYNEIKQLTSPHAAMVIDALEEAIRASAKNVSGFDYNTRVLIANDVSGSMGGTISKHSKIRSMDVGLILGMILRHNCKSVVTGVFGEQYATLLTPSGNILQNTENMKVPNVGHSTNGHLVLRAHEGERDEFDKVFLITDTQLWNNSGFYSWGGNGGGGDTFRKAWHDYKRNVAPNAKLYIVDVAGHGNTPISIMDKDVYYVAGWSDKIFDVLDAIENGSGAVEEIRKIEL
jgi:hypothetical protein|tara:strand:+ start:4926 stop:6392 length:1467 start_codon:yes stop_codon:yes gene_type:complete